MKYQPKIIDDIEIIPFAISIHTNCVATNKTNRSLMIRFKFDHCKEQSIGYADVILTTEQVEELIKLLNLIPQPL